MVAFRSAADAVRCAVDMQQAVPSQPRAGDASSRSASACTSASRCATRTTTSARRSWSPSGCATRPTAGRSSRPIWCGRWLAAARRRVPDPWAPSSSRAWPSRAAWRSRGNRPAAALDLPPALPRGDRALFVGRASRTRAAGQAWEQACAGTGSSSCSGASRASARHGWRPSSPAGPPRRRDGAVRAL